MPNLQQHQDKIKHNQDFLSTFFQPGNATQFPDWTITVIFYIALHWVEAYFSKVYNKSYANHTDRNSALTQEKRLTPIYGDYKRLDDWSRDARYQYVKFSEKDLAEAVRRLENVEKRIKPLLT